MQTKLYKSEVSYNPYRSLYPKIPSEVYFEHIQSAKDGNPRSMYWVGRSISDCSSVRSPSQLNEDIRKVPGLIDEEFLSRAAAKNERCFPLIKELGYDYLNDFGSHYTWLLDSFENGDSLAGAWMLQMHPDKFSSSEARSMIETAILNSADDLVFVASSVGTYLSNYKDSEFDDVYAEAYEFSLCRLNSSVCDIELYKQFLKDNYLPIDLEETLTKADKIEQAIRTVDLGLL